jgi:hypothetical protein
MCRNIKLLYNLDPGASRDEVHASALQYVRKISGMRAPAAANQAAFDAAVEQITEISMGLLGELSTRSAPKSRAAEAEKARARGRKRDERMRQKLLAELDQAQG